MFADHRLFPCRRTEFKELRKQWRLAKKEADESRDRARLMQLEREQQEEADRRVHMELGLTHGVGPSMMGGTATHLPSGLPMAAHGMRTELVNVGLPVESSMGVNLNPNLPSGMPVSLSGSMAGPVLSPAMPFNASMAMSSNHGLAGPAHGMGSPPFAGPPRFARSQTTGSFDFHLAHHPQSLHPHAQQLAAQRHRGSFDAQAQGRVYDEHRYEYDHRRASFDQGHRVGAYESQQYELAMGMGALRRRGSQPYPSPHSLTHSPHTLAHSQGHHSPRSIYSTQSGGLAYAEDEYDGYEYQDSQSQPQPSQSQHHNQPPPPQSPQEDRYGAEGDYYSERTQPHSHHQQRTWDIAPSLASFSTPHPQTAQSLSLATQGHPQPHGHLAGPGLVQVESSSPTTGNTVGAELPSDSEPLLTSQGHVSLGSNRLPPNSTLLTPLPGFRGYEPTQHAERWDGEEEDQQQHRRNL